MPETSSADLGDERIKSMSSIRQALIRPELGGMCGTVLVFAFFLLTAFDSGMFGPAGVLNWSVVSAQFMIIAVGACLLMIAGEFDLSVGSMIGFAGMMIAIFSVTLGWPVWLAIVLAFVICVACGALNGFIVVRTGLPSFIVTLAFCLFYEVLQFFFRKHLSVKPSLGVSETQLGGIGWRLSFLAKSLLDFFNGLGMQGLSMFLSAATAKGNPLLRASRC
jgi:simple sugar transport system permease protein